MIVELWRSPVLPFSIGTMPAPQNSAGLPLTLPFTLEMDEALCLVRQHPDATVARYLEHAYASGSLLGTAMDDTTLGRRYAEDFVAFLERNHASGLAGLRVLEIGAGRGFLLRCLQEKGAECIGIEPGASNAEHWSRHGVKVVADSFPSPQLSGDFDLILAYAVLEHIADPAGFLSAATALLRPGGKLALAVPDCTAFIGAGDPSMLLHEHYLYFTAGSLQRLLAHHGLPCLKAEKAGYGGVLYALAVPDKAAIATAEIPAKEMADTRRFGARCDALVGRVSELVRQQASSGRSLGIYCPARGLAFLPQDGAYRFFDDDPDLTGRYYPPFNAPVETRAALIDDPVDELWILSRTFGERLRSALNAEPSLARCHIRVLDELAPEEQ